MTTVGRRRDRGESLVEVVLTVVIMSVAVSALVSGLATAANASGAHQQSVLADTTLRNLAEAAKLAARTCTPGDPFEPTTDVPEGWTGAVSPVDATCPSGDETLTLSLRVTSPTDQTWAMDIVVRTP